MKSKILLSVRKAAFGAAFLVFTLAMSMLSHGARQPVFPDFAFPEKVEKSAASAMDNALQKGDDVAALQAAVQMIVARNQVSADSFSQNVALLDSLSEVLKPPYSNMADLLEATLYNQLYTSNRWQFRQRVLPLDDYPDDPMAWSGSLFAQKVLSLVDKANKNVAQAKTTPITAITPLLVNSDYAVKSDFTVYDFMVGISSNLLSTYGGGGVSSSVIPFFKDTQPVENTVEDKCAVKRRELINALYDWRVKEDKIPALVAAIRLKADNLDQKEKVEFLSDWVSRLKALPESGALIHDYYEAVYPTAQDNESDCKALYALLDDWIKRFPTSSFTPALKYDVAQLGRKSASITLPSVALSSQEIKGSVKVDNINSLYILLYRVPESIVPMNSLNVKEIPSKAKFVKAIMVQAEGTVPFSTQKQFTLPALPQGYYVAIPSTKPSLSSNWKNEVERWSLSVLNISDIAVISSYNTRQKESGKLYVVEASTQRPVKGAEVKFYSDKNLKQPVKTLYTDDSGSVASPEGHLRVRAAKGNNVIWTYSDLYYEDGQQSERYNGRILTDLSIYKPGDEVGFAVVMWSGQGHDNHLLAATDIKAVLRDANWQVVDTLKLTTDVSGRCSGRFKVPQSGLLGNYSISVSTMTDAKRDVASCNFQVAEYKAPTFFVTVEGDKESVYKPGDMIKFTGEVKTYSGMALADSQVNFTVEWQQWWRWWSAGINNATYSATASVDSQGKFVIELPTDNLKGTPFERGIFSLSVTATSPSGETQTSPALRFALGSGFTLRPSLPENLKVTGDTLQLNVPVYDLLDHPVREKVNYSVTDVVNGKTLSSGSFESPLLSLPSSLLPSGKYNFSFTLPSEKDTTAREMVIWRETDRRPPFATPLWVPVDKVIVANDADSVDIRVGSGYADSWVLCLLSDENRILEQKWLKINEENMSVTLPAPKVNSRRWINLVGMHDHAAKRATVALVPEQATQKMEVKTLSFRDKISAGDKEKWIFSFNVADKLQDHIPAIAVMSNKSLNALAPFSWNFTLAQDSWYDRSRLSFTNSQQRTVRAGFSVMPRYKMPDLSLPDWQTYDYPLGGISTFGGTRIRGVRKMAMSRNSEYTEVEEQVFVGAVENQVYMASKSVATMDMADAAPAPLAEAEVMEDGEAKAAGSTSEAERTELRPVEMPLAFFMPTLTTDAEGKLNVEFVTPNFNTTWQFQIMAYNSDLKSAGTLLEAVASKPVMVQVNPPRYLRTGDKATVSALLFNNSPESQMLDGELVIFDPISGETIKSYHIGAEETVAGGNRTVSIDFIVGNDLSALGIKAYANAANYSDGEQVLVPVLPSSTPVVESTQFYLGTGSGVFSQKLPKYRKEANLTLKYCANPVWECVLALPAIATPDSKNTLALSKALYANGMAQGIVDRFPAVRSGLDMLDEAGKKGDPAVLKSNLQKDSLLKTVALTNTPWVNNAAAETMRLKNLSDLLDAQRPGEAIKSLQDQLLSLQKADGGWSWCDGMKSSEFITSSVLSNLAPLTSYGIALDKNMLSKAIAYCDKEFYESYIKSDKTFSTIAMLRYLYVRGQYDKGNGKGGFSSLKKEALKAIDSDWKNFSIYDKATAALLLNRSEGYEKTARVILESLRQLASKSESKGWWYDNLTGGWTGMPKLATTARVLEAFSEIQPASEAVDGLRQWLVLQKETEDWGANSSSVGVISAILNSGTDWTVVSDAPVIKLDGHVIDVANGEMLTGLATVQLDVKEASGKTLSIEKNSDGPAWGGVISQYIAPMADVKAEKCENLKVEKQLLLLTEDDGGVKAEKVNLSKGSFKVGDKVRVTLILTCDKDMDYVALIDERAACLEPLDQLSSYNYTDGLGAYREIRDTKTSFFINYLPKGVNVISYDCYVDRDGVYALGIASAQSQYSPLQAAHSAGGVITVESRNK